MNRNNFFVAYGRLCVCTGRISVIQRELSLGAYHTVAVLVDRSGKPEQIFVVLDVNEHFLIAVVALGQYLKIDLAVAAVCHRIIRRHNRNIKVNRRKCRYTRKTHKACAQHDDRKQNLSESVDVFTYHQIKCPPKACKDAQYINRLLLIYPHEIISTDSLSLHPPARRQCGESAAHPLLLSSRG